MELVFLIDWLFPIKCYRCALPGEYLCSECQIKVRLLKQEFCPRPNSSIKRLISLYAYQPPLDKMLQDYKYNQVRGLKGVLVKLLASGLEKSKIVNYWRKNKFIFVPVPLHPFKKLHRGFNQASELVVDVCQQLDLNYQTNLVRRIKWTKSQTKLSFPARKNNLKQAFKVNFQAVNAGSNLVLFDDVTTTGSTLLSCAKAFQNSKINTIHALTIFRKL